MGNPEYIYSLERTLRNLIAAFLACAFDYLTDFGKYILVALGLKNGLKKFLRRVG